MEDFFQQTIDTVSKATDLDRKEQYAEALVLYKRAFKLFDVCEKHEKMPQRLETLRHHMQDYVKRAMEIEEALKNQSAAGSGGGNKGEDDKGNDEAERMRKNLEGAIVMEKPNVKWEDVVGLEVAKASLHEAVILPIKMPHLFIGERRPWRGILLYGPPGTGKSFLAKAVATMADSTFLSISSSDLVSKWLGESEKLVRTMFEMARQHRPTIIFVDEIDSLCGARSDTESESARRIKTEFLVQMQGVGNDMDGVLVLAATNIPWNIDSAIRRRFEKRIYIPLPDAAARAGMFRTQMDGEIPHNLVDADFARLGQMTEGYSGSDVNVVLRDAIMEPVRKLQFAQAFKRVTGPDPLDPKNGLIYDDLLMGCSPGEPGAIMMTLMDVPPNKLVPPPVTMRDFEKAVSRSRPSVNKADLTMHEQFTREFGQMGVEEGEE